MLVVADRKDSDFRAGQIADLDGRANVIREEQVTLVISSLVSLACPAGDGVRGLVHQVQAHGYVVRAVVPQGSVIRAEGPGAAAFRLD